MSADLKRLGDVLRADELEGRDPGREAALRARFVLAATRPSKGKLLVLAWPAAAAAAIMAVAAIRSAGSSAEAPPPPAFGFFVGADGQRGEVGTTYAAPTDGPLDLRFDDGSRVKLEHGSGLRVSRASDPETALSVEHGTLRFDVEHEPSRRWLVTAGPYGIHVTGTSFTVDWSGEPARLTLQMHEGRVWVNGPGIDGRGVEVRNQERFVSAAPAPRREPPLDVPAAAASPSPAVAAPRVHARSAENAMPAAPVTEPASPTWSQWVARGESDRVLSEAEGLGVDHVLTSSSEGDLRALADAARFRGRTALARRALSSLRERFRASRNATQAAFMLGRLEDGVGNTERALEWYEAYLAHGGSLAAEARGRKMIALHKLGRTAEARTGAKEYLERHPKGAYAAHASDIAR